MSSIEHSDKDLSLSYFTYIKAYYILICYEIRIKWIASNKYILVFHTSAGDWTLVSVKYMTGKTSPLQKNSWLDFFTTIGLKLFVDVQTKPVELHASDLVGWMNFIFI